MVKVTERFYIDADSKCYMLKEKTTIKDAESQNYGKEIYKDLGYHTTIESCLNGILKATTREFISKEETKSIKDLQEEIKSQNEFLKSLKLDV
jgi:hypothetical protein